MRQLIFNWSRFYTPLANFQLSMEEGDTHRADEADMWGKSMEGLMVQQHIKESWKDYNQLVTHLT